MRIPPLILLLSSAVPASAQMVAGDLLVNSFSAPDLIVHYRPDGTVVQSSSGGTGALWEGSAILPNGDWATSRRLPAGVNIFDGATGAEIASWDTPGFTVPGDVGAFSDGTLAVVDQGGKVWHFRADGTLIASWSVSANPFGILVDDQDTVWTCDWLAGLLWHTDHQGNKLGEFTTGGSAGDVTMAADGTLFVTRRDVGEVAHYAQDGTLLGSFVATGNLFCSVIAMGNDQTLWVSGQQEPDLMNFDQAGTLLGSISFGPAKSPIFLTILVPGGKDIGTNYCGPANLNSTGQSAVISAFGSTKVAKNLVALTARQMPPGAFGYYLNSDVKGFAPFFLGSQGNLCLGAGVGRHTKQVGNSGAAGELTIDLSLTALPRPGGTHSVLAGETWNFQCWFRDNNGGPTSNFTDGIEIVFQ